MSLYNTRETDVWTNVCRNVICSCPTQIWEQREPNIQMCVFTNVLNMRVCVSVSQCLLSADCADQLSDAAWVIGDQHGSLRVETETSLVQAVQGRSHQQYRVTSHRGHGALQGVKSECNQQVTGTMLRAVLMLSLVALSVTQRRPPPGVNKLCEFYDIIHYFVQL